MSGADTMHSLDARLGDPLAALGVRDDAIGFVGCDIPIDVLLASGRPFGHLPWRAAGETPRADRWLESSFPFWARSVLEQWHEGAFDALGTVVFSRADDASQRLYYYVRELQRRSLLRGPMPQMFDIALLPRESSVAHTAAAILALGREIGVEPSRLCAGIERANRLRATLERFAQHRVAHGALYERLARAALWSDPTRWIDDIALPADGAGGRRVLLAGSVPPDDRFHRAVESAGACVIAEAHVHEIGRLGAAVAAVAGEPPERALARQLMHASTGPRAVLDRAAWIVARATAARAAVILWLTREDEALAWHVPVQVRALATAGIPTLVLPAARWSADDGALERIVEFCRGLVDATP
jgi:hypothetical protein